MPDLVPDDSPKDIRSQSLSLRVSGMDVAGQEPGGIGSTSCLGRSVLEMRRIDIKSSSLIFTSFGLKQTIETIEALFQRKCQQQRLSSSAAVERWLGTSLAS